MVAQIDEQHAAVIAHAMHPAGQPHGLADVAVAQRAAGVGTIAMHGVRSAVKKRAKGACRALFVKAMAHARMARHLDSVPAICQCNGSCRR